MDLPLTIVNDPGSDELEEWDFPNQTHYQVHRLVRKALYRWYYAAWGVRWYWQAAMRTRRHGPRLPVPQGVNPLNGEWLTAHHVFGITRSLIRDLQKGVRDTARLWPYQYDDVQPYGTDRILAMHAMRQAGVPFETARSRDFDSPIDIWEAVRMSKVLADSLHFDVGLGPNYERDLRSMIRDLEELVM